jgi:hypothetical protein
MEYKPTPEKIIDYLYGELPEAEQKIIKQYLKENPEKQQEIEAMMGVREVMQKVAEVNPPADQYTGFRQVNEMDSKLRSWRKIAAVALLLLAGALAAWVSDLNISTQNNALVISFGAPELPRVEQPVVEKPAIKDEQPNNLPAMQNMLASYNDSVQMQMQAMQRIIARLQQPAVVTVENEQYLTRDELAVMLEDMMVENQAFYTSLTNAANQQQQDYYQAVLTDMYQFLNEQRKSDFELMQQMMASIKLDSDVKIQETENILTNLIAKIDEKNEN